MKRLVDVKKFKLYLWIGLCGLFISMFVTLLTEPEYFLKVTTNHIWLMIYVIVIHFILFEYTVPFINLSWKRLLAAPLLLFTHFILYSYGIYTWRVLGIKLHIFTVIKESKDVSETLQYYAAYSLSSVIFFGVIRHIYHYKKLKIAAQHLRIEKQEAELNFLKSQTNPHFLFNTLNNIYSLSKDKSDLAPESILRLSKILRFMLYETGGDYISIEDEMKIVMDYIALEKLRYDDSLLIKLNTDVEDMKQSLPPLLLIPLVENAFKHGVSETRSRPFIDIHLSVNQIQLLFIVKNSAEAASAEQHVKENIGLSNLRRQLQLLYKEYDLSVKQDESVFTSSLKINLSSHV